MKSMKNAHTKCILIYITGLIYHNKGGAFAILDEKEGQIVDMTKLTWSETRIFHFKGGAFAVLDEKEGKLGKMDVNQMVWTVWYDLLY